MNDIEILIVEDSVEDAQLMLRSLKKHNLANNVVILEDGQEALDYLFCEGAYSDRNCSPIPNVVFLDLKLPKVNGIQVLERLKSSPRTKSLPVVVVTSSQEEPDLKVCYDLGVNSYVVKPVDFESFIKVISDLGFYWLVINKSKVTHD